MYATEWYELSMQVLLNNVATYKHTIHHGENWNHLLCREGAFLACNRPQYLGIDQWIKQTYLYLRYPLFQTQWDTCDHQITKSKLFSERTSSINRNVNITDWASLLLFLLRGSCMQCASYDQRSKSVRSLALFRIHIWFFEYNIITIC